MFVIKKEDTQPLGESIIVRRGEYQVSEDSNPELGYVWIIVDGIKRFASTHTIVILPEDSIKADKIREKWRNIWEKQDNRFKFLLEGK